jgi:hypothetical protein
MVEIKYEVGILKKDLLTYFNEFDIHDMRIASKDCWSCKKGFKCDIHVYERVENPLINEE